MKIVRAFPQSPPMGRNYVMDGWQKVPVDAYDYWSLVMVGDDVICMDWDTAISREDLLRFARHAAETPEEVLVGPCLMYPPGLPPTWNVSRVDDRGFVVHAEEGEYDECHLFGFGLVYLPLPLIRRFVEEVHGVGRPMSDGGFSEWHHTVVSEFARVDWSVRMVHLHYVEAERGYL